MQDDNNIETQNPESGVDGSYTSSNVAPNGKILPKIYNGAKKAANNIKNGVKAVGKVAAKVGSFLLTHPHILIALAVAGILFIIVAELLKLTNIENVTRALDETANQVFDSWDSNNLTDEQKLAKESYEKTGSFMDMAIMDISKMKDIFTAEKDDMEKNSPAKDLFRTYRLLSTTKGSIVSIFGDGAVTLDDFRTMYEHILLISKYDFNNVKWKWYSHESDGGDSPMHVDKNLGVRYPDDSAVNSGGQTKYATFSSLLKPYLLSYEVPMSFFCGILSDRDLDEDMAVTFTHAIIQNGLSDITVNRYDTKRYELNTYYEDYNYDEYQSQFTVTFIPGEDGNYTISYGGIGEIPSGSNGHKNTRENDAGEVDNMLEYFVSDNTDISCKYFVADAKMFDEKIKTSYNYVPYSDDDAKNRRNGQESPVTSPLVAGDIRESQNKLENINGIGGSTNNYSQAIAAIGGGNNATSSTPVANSDGSITVSFTVNSKYRKIVDGIKVDINRVWSDELAQGSTEQGFYTVEDLIEYNENLKHGKLTADELKADEKSYKYYENMAKNEEINRIDMLNSNPTIIAKYFSEGNKYLKYCGFSKEYLNAFCYPNLKSLYQKVKEKNNNTFPYIYGKTLGFGSTQGSSSSQSISGMSLLKAYIRSFEGSGEKPVTPNSEGVDCYVAYRDTGGKLTVGYGVNLDAHPAYKKSLEDAIKTTIDVDTLVPVELVDAIEDELIGTFYNNAKSAMAGIPDVKEYQLHALASLNYNGIGISKVASLYTNPSYWNEAEDDKYDELSKKYKDDTENVTAITSEADLERGMYKDFWSLYIHDSKGNKLDGLIRRRKSEYMIFSLGYYDTLKRFYSAGGSNMADIDLLNGDQINEAAVVELQNWYQDTLFAPGGPKALDGNNNGSIYKNIGINVTTSQRDSLNSINPEYRMYFAVTGRNRSSEYTGVIPVNEHFQCTWWAESMGYYFLYTNSGGKITETFGKGNNLGDGGSVASTISTVYHVPTYSVSQLEVGKHYILSLPSIGHVIYVEAVGKDNIVVSHCGSGKKWYGVTSVSRSSHQVNGIYVCMEDILATYGY